MSDSAQQEPRTIDERLERLSPPQRALLEQRLRQARHAPQPSPPATAPLSFGQERLLFLWQMDPASVLYNSTVFLRLEGALNFSALQQALDEITARHEPLRTVFRIGGSAVSQNLLTPGPVAIRRFDLTDLPPEHREAALAARAVAEARVPFDLVHGPVIRAALWRVDETHGALLVGVHHIAFDGWSRNVFVRELARRYQALTAKTEEPVAPLQYSYSQYAAWQHAYAGGERFERDLAYWQDHLDGAPDLLNLPLDRPRPAVLRGGGACVPIHLDKDLADRLAALGRENSATLFMVLLAGYYALLRRWTGQDDVVVAMPVAGRSRLEMEDLIGFFVNTLALRLREIGSLSFVDLIGQVRGIVTGGLAHQDAPFEKLIERLEIRRDMSRSPISQVMIVLQDAPERPVSAGDLTFQPRDLFIGIARFDLDLNLWVTTDGAIAGYLAYNSDLFDERTICGMAAGFEILLRAAVQEPRASVGDLPVMSESDREEVVRAWNRTETDYDLERTLSYWIERQVDRTPDACAAVFEGKTLTYFELDVHANRLARRLVSEGAGPETLVGVCAERSLDLLVMLVAVLKAGAAYVPLDPSLPEGRLAFMLEDSAPVVVLAQERFRHLMTGGVSVICTDSDAAEIAALPADRLESRAGPDNLAYMIYTSGSTGQPKGALNTHRGICNRLLWAQSVFFLTGVDRVLQKTPFSFDVSVWEFFGPLIAGACLVMARPEGHKDPRYLAEIVRMERITTIHFVPSMLQAFLSNPQAASCASLLRVMCSGEALPAELAARFFQLFDAELYNLYGPTEAAVDVTYRQCRRDENSANIPIGRPIANTWIYILDPHRQPVPAGVAGELTIGGACVGRGYRNRPELTAERFFDDPFRPGGRVYRTGDLARYRADGEIEFLGRMDRQVKIRGNRIELGEIEAAIRAFSGIRESAALVDDPGTGDRIVAYLVADDLEIPALRAHLRSCLPEYMVPAQFMPVAEIPLSPNGKRDLSRLPKPTAEDPAEAPAVEADGPIEPHLLPIWQSLFPGREIGVEDNFFDLGGHSLLAARMVGMIEEQIGLRLPLQQLFQTPTIREIARALLQREFRELQSVKKVLAGKEGVTPLFFLHGDLDGVGLYCRRLANLMDPDQPFYGIAPMGACGEPAPWSVEESAAAQLQWVRAIHAHGPYLFGGFCNGAAIAYEMARQARAAGERVDGIILVEPPTANLDERRVLRITKTPIAVTARDSRTRLLRLLKVSKRLACLFRIETCSKDALGDLFGHEDKPLFVRLFNRYKWVLWSYLPPKSKCPVVVVRCRNGKASFTRDEELWRKAAPNLEYSLYDGNHASLIRERIDILADAVDRLTLKIKAGRADMRSPNVVH